MIRRMSLRSLRGSAIICLTLLADAAPATLDCDAAAHTEGAGSILLQLRSQRFGISDPVQELPTDEATSAKHFCRFDGYLPYWAAIGERTGDYGVACTNDFLCEKMKVDAQLKCGFEIMEAKCESGVSSKDYKGLIDAKNGTAFSQFCGYETLGPGKVFAQSCSKRAKYMTASSCQQRCDTWDDCTGYMTGDQGRDCFVVGRVAGDCPAGYSHTSNSFSSDGSAESFAKILSCYTQAAAGQFLFFGHTFSCEDFEDYEAKEDTAAAAAAALEFQRKAAAQTKAQAFCQEGVPGFAKGGVPVCCGGKCGECGGAGCGGRPGGGSKCCTGSILEAKRQCMGPGDTACVIPAH